MRTTGPRWLTPTSLSYHRCEKIAADLLSDVEPTNNVEVTLWIDLFEVIQQPSPTTDHHQQASPTGEVLFMTVHMLGQGVDPCRQDGNLNFRRARIGIATLVLAD